MNRGEWLNLVGITSIIGLEFYSILLHLWTSLLLCRLKKKVPTFFYLTLDDYVRYVHEKIVFYVYL